jgi:hypothetical protein
MSSGAVIYVPSSIKMGSGIQKLKGQGIHRHTHIQSKVKSILLFFQNKENKLKIHRKIVRKHTPTG